MKSAALEAITPERLARLEQMLDRQDILDCLIRFSRGMDRFDRDIAVAPAAESGESDSVASGTRGFWRAPALARPVVWETKTGR